MTTNREWPHDSQQPRHSFHQERLTAQFKIMNEKGKRRLKNLQSKEHKGFNVGAMKYELATRVALEVKIVEYIELVCLISGNYSFKQSN